MLSEKAEQMLNELAESDITISAIKTAIEIAKDEEVRVIWQRLMKESVEKDRTNEVEYQRLNKLGRNMFYHHAQGRSYPWTLDALREGRVTQAEVGAYLESQEDPEPKSTFARPRHT
jgi:hypothetical protein